MVGGTWRGADVPVNGPLVHPSAIVEEASQIGAGTKVWHFSHVMSGAVIGERCLRAARATWVATGSGFRGRMPGHLHLPLHRLALPRGEWCADA